MAGRAGTTNFEGVDVVPLQGVDVCHCRVPLQCAMVGKEGGSLHLKFSKNQLPTLVSEAFLRASGTSQ